MERICLEKKRFTNKKKYKGKETPIGRIPFERPRLGLKDWVQRDVGSPKPNSHWIEIGDKMFIQRYRYGLDWPKSRKKKKNI